MKWERNQHTDARDTTTIAGDTIAVGQSDITFANDLKTETPNLFLRVNSRVILLTWDEMREVANAMIEMADLSEFG